MPDPIDFPERTATEAVADNAIDRGATDVGIGVPSNEVYARVGDVVLRAAREGIRRGDSPETVMRQISDDHHVHLTRGELRLLLASRRVRP